jgi:hypothetical protein
MRDAVYTTSASGTQPLSEPVTEIPLWLEGV